MARTISDLRALFDDPPATARPLAIIHSFDRMLQHRAGASGTMHWMPPIDPAELSDGLSAALERMRSMGFGGVVANVDFRNYLRDEDAWRVFTEAAKVCREMGLRLWIYDEVGYPSGAAGGLVLEGHPEFEAQVLARGKHAVGPGEVEVPSPSGWRRTVKAAAHCDRGELDITDCVDEAGTLRWRAPAECSIERYDVRPGYEGTHATLNVHAMRRYINVLDPEAVQRFYDITYQAYIDRLGSDIEQVEAFFTDEPSFMAAYYPEVPERYQSRVPIRDEPIRDYDRLPQLPWRDSMPEDFEQRWGYPLLPGLGSLFEGESADDLHVRHDFNCLLSELYAESFFGTLQKGLDEHGIPLSGHALAEEPIIQHVATQGSLMMALGRMRFPGIDMLTSSPERLVSSRSMLTCKYGSSSAHVKSRSDIMSEVSDWEEQNEGRDTSLAERRGALGAQSALGITTFASYYRWKGFEREEIRDLADFCARVNPCVRFGKHVAHAAVLYPIRTAWARYIPTHEVLSSATQHQSLREMDDALLEIAGGLVGQGIDFDFVDSRSLAECKASEGRFVIADEAYQLLVIPPETVVCPMDIETIRRVADAGVRVTALEPLSEVCLAEGVGESAREAILATAGVHPNTVAVAERGGDWARTACEGIEKDLVLAGDTDGVLVRQSRFEDGDAFLVVNASGRAVDLQAQVEAPAEVWNPWDGTADELSGTLEIEAYGARIIVRTR